jgi:hypothetical protein
MRLAIFRLLAQWRRRLDTKLGERLLVRLTGSRQAPRGLELLNGGTRLRSEDAVRLARIEAILVQGHLKLGYPIMG